MCTPTAWQLGEDFKGKLLPVLRDVKELNGKIELEISHKRDEMEFGPMSLRVTNTPTPEDPEKIRKLGENVIRVIQQTIKQYESLCDMEADKGAVQETGQVTTTCPEIEENQSENMVMPTPETETPKPFCLSPEIMEYQETFLPEENQPGITAPVSPTPRRRLQRGAAVVNEETIDLGHQ